MKLYESTIIEYRSQEADKRQKAEEKRSSSGGEKNFTHNVKG
jgi:hypothetical protein